MSEQPRCWRCGADLPDVSTDVARSPLPRAALCPSCNADLHVCKMCVFHASGIARECREPVAEPVRDKTRANFCGYFRVRVDAYRGVDEDAARQAGAELAALFGEQPPATKSGSQESSSPAELARRQFEDLFKP